MVPYVTIALILTLVPIAAPAGTAGTIAGTVLDAETT